MGYLILYDCNMCLTLYESDIILRLMKLRAHQLGLAVTKSEIILGPRALIPEESLRRTGGGGAAVPRARASRRIFSCGLKTPPPLYAAPSGPILKRRIFAARVKS